MIEPECPEPLGFTDALRVFREKDQELYELVARNLTHKSWHQLMVELKLHRPKLFREIGKGILALKKDQESYFASPKKDAREGLKAIARDLVRSYKCDKGFVEEEPQKKTVIVRLRLPEAVTGLPADIMYASNRLARDHGGVNKWTFGFDNRIFVTDLTDDAIEELRKNPLVEAVEEEPIARIMSGEIPQYNPAAVNTDWGVERCFPTNAWNKGLKGEGIKVLVIDTGIRAAHIAWWLNEVSNYKGGYNFVANSDNPDDDHDHGTYCCGIIAHRHTGVNGHYRGLAPNCDLYACKALDAKGSGSFANIAAAIDWGRTMGMDVISMSLGASQGSDVLKAACDAAWYAGIVLVGASGNESQQNSVSFPARYQSVIAVGAADFNENIANFSNKGPEIELAAPGVAIVGPWAGNTYADYQVTGSGGLYMCASGTSAATPHVAACATLIKQWYPAMTNAQIREWLRVHARDL